ncbi:MAG: MATE family efflux transporter, partial [Flavobacteriales bacterium]|nr:MATE family efflux transporter [Flavobacteriales bacterium]
MKIENEYIANIRLAIPVMLGQSANVLTGLVDNYMLARLGGSEGELALSAGATAGAVFILVLLVGTGISCGMTPFVAFSHAQKDSKEIDRIFRNGWVMNACIGIIFALLLYVTAPLLSHPALGQVDEITSLAIPYLRIVGFSLIPVMIFQSYKQTIDGLGNTW